MRSAARSRRRRTKRVAKNAAEAGSAAVTMSTPAGWHPDPFGRSELRYWNGGQWTSHVSSHGRQYLEPPEAPAAPTPPAAPAPPLTRGPASAPAPPGNARVKRQVRKLGLSSAGTVGGGTLFSEPVLVFRQKAKVVELNAEYAVYSQSGVQVASVREVGMTLMRKAMGTPLQQRTTTRTLQFSDMNGQILLRLVRPKMMFRSKMVVSGGDGRNVGHIMQRTLELAGVIGFSMRFDLESDGKRVGTLVTDGVTGWGCRFENCDGDEVAQLSRTWAGMSKEMFTKADNYVLHLNRPLQEPCCRS